MPKISIYKLRKGNAPLKSMLASSSEYVWLDEFSSIPDCEEQALAVFEGAPQLPPWATFLAGSYTLPESLVSQTPRGVLLLRMNSGGAAYAVPFGFGAWQALDDRLVVSGWGRRIALNLLYASDGKILNRGRSIRKQRRAKLGQNVSTDATATRPVSHEELGFNAVEDILRSVKVVTRRPNWGRTFEGADNASLTWKGAATSLPELLSELEDLASLKHYQEHFKFVDDLEPVRASEERKRVWEECALRIRKGKTDGLGLSSDREADPEEVFYADLSLLGLKGLKSKGGLALPGFEINDYTEVLSTNLAKSDLQSLTDTDLKKHYIRYASDTAGIRTLYVWKALEGSIAVGGKTYAVLEGKVYSVGSKYIKTLDEYVDDIQTVDNKAVKLPRFASAPERKKPIKSAPGFVMIRDECAYNRHAGSPKSRLVLDAELVQVPGVTSTVEVCDILAAGPLFMHVKRGTRSSTLSHLFAQASVSGELFLRSRPFRKATRKKIEEVCGKGGAQASKDRKKFQPLIPLGAAPSTSRIDLCIISSGFFTKTGALRPTSKALPFFSKVNLRACHMHLTERRYDVRIVAIAP